MDLDAEGIAKLLNPVVSSNIKKVGYHDESKTLLVEFNNNGLYAYDAVPIELFNEMIQAKTVGAYFSKMVRNSFKCTKLR